MANPIWNGGPSLKLRPLSEHVETFLERGAQREGSRAFVETFERRHAWDTREWPRCNSFHKPPCPAEETDLGSGLGMSLQAWCLGAVWPHAGHPSLPSHTPPLHPAIAGSISVVGRSSKLLFLVSPLPLRFWPLLLSQGQPPPPCSSQP